MTDHWWLTGHYFIGLSPPLRPLVVSLSLFPRCSAGFLLFLRGFINYARIRKMADTLSTLPRTRVLFIYWAHSRHRHSFPPSQWSVLSGFIQSQREKRRRFPSAWHDLDNTSVFPFWCKKVICCKTIQLLVVYCQVLFAVLKCVMCKWMPYFLFVCLLVAAARAVLLPATRGQSGLCLLSPLFYQMMSRFSALDSGYFGDYGLIYSVWNNIFHVPFSCAFNLFVTNASFPPEIVYNSAKMRTKMENDPLFSGYRHRKGRECIAVQGHGFLFLL